MRGGRWAGRCRVPECARLVTVVVVAPRLLLLLSSDLRRSSEA